VGTEKVFMRLQMKSLDISQYLVETYLSLLKNLDNNSKLELISALSLSMKDRQKKEEGDCEFFGSLSGDTDFWSIGYLRKGKGTIEKNGLCGSNTTH
jgi:hypothetical protein